jgi:tRNA uridine 5-carbamoylmethylation protein Kti12
MPTAYILVGIPGSGKTTWTGHQKIDWDKTSFIGTDKFVEQDAKNQGKTYSEVFNDSMQHALTKMVNDVVQARENEKDIIWDQTSTTIQSRKRKFNMLPNYKMVAVVFPIPNAKELQRRLDSRPGKVIPPDVIKAMIDNFEEPTTDEGFDEIIHVK